MIKLATVYFKLCIVGIVLLATMGAILVVPSVRANFLKAIGLS